MGEELIFPVCCNFVIVLFTTIQECGSLVVTSINAEYSDIQIVNECSIKASSDDAFMSLELNSCATNRDVND